MIDKYYDFQLNFTKNKQTRKKYMQAFDAIGQIETRKISRGIRGKL